MSRGLLVGVVSWKVSSLYPATTPHLLGKPHVSMLAPHSTDAEGEHQHAGHLFGPLFIRRPNPRFLHGPFRVGDMDRPLSGWGYGPAPSGCGYPPAETGAFMSGTKGCSEVAWRQSVARVREYLNHVVQEIRWADRLNPFSHCPIFRSL